MKFAAPSTDKPGPPNFCSHPAGIAVAIAGLAFAVAVIIAVTHIFVVIPQGSAVALVVALAMPLLLSLPRGVCFCPCPSRSVVLHRLIICHSAAKRRNLLLPSHQPNAQPSGPALPPFHKNALPLHSHRSKIHPSLTVPPYPETHRIASSARIHKRQRRDNMPA